MSSYASHTSVPVDRSKADIEATLERYGATHFAYMCDNTKGEACVGFIVQGRKIRIVLPLPQLTECATTAKGRKRCANAAEQERSQEVRRRWRALLLVIKSKLEAVSSGIATFENEFLAYVVLSDGQTFGEWAAPQLDRAATGKMPLLLEAGR